MLPRRMALAMWPIPSRPSFPSRSTSHSALSGVSSQHVRPEGAHRCGQGFGLGCVDLGRRWGIGRKDIDDGVLLIVAPNERKARIEVGYGLEKALRDEEAGRIMRDAILPAFRAGDLPKGIAAGVDGIVREIGPGARA